MGAVIICIFVACVIGVVRMLAKRIKQSQEIMVEPNHNSSEPVSSAEEDFPVKEFKATVLDQACTVKTVGTKTPKTVKEFAVLFSLSNGKTKSFLVPEEMYDGFEKGQVGVLTVVGEELYSFEIEETQL